MVKFSIITPSYNQAAFITDTLESVLQQDYPNVEYIVIDGGSTDGTVEILHSYGKRLTWISEADEGQSDAINKGFRMASGDVFAWLNSDDTYLPGALREVATFLEDNPMIDMVYGDLMHVGAKGQFIKHYVAPAFDPTLLLRWNFIPQPACFFRSYVWERVKGLDPSLRYAFDRDLWLKIAQQYKIGKVPAELATFRWHRQSKTFTSAWAHNREAILTVRRRFVTYNIWTDLYDTASGTLRALIRSIYYRLAAKT